MDSTTFHECKTTTWAARDTFKDSLVVFMAPPEHFYNQFNAQVTRSPCSSVTDTTECILEVPSVLPIQLKMRSYSAIAFEFSLVFQCLIQHLLQKQKLQLEAEPFTGEAAQPG